MADQVESLLRTENLKKAKKDFTEGKITSEQLHEIEIQEIKRIVDKQVVLGLVTSKTGKLEEKENIKVRVQEAAKYVPLEQLAIRPQCGFASTHHGNILTEEEQWEKLRFVVETAKEIWG